MSSSVSTAAFNDDDGRIVTSHAVLADFIPIYIVFGDFVGFHKEYLRRKEFLMKKNLVVIEELKKQGKRTKNRQ